jgi:hypothetical protein
LAAVSLDEELFEAVKSGDAARVKELLRRGANPNARDEYGLCPLHYAPWNRRAEVARVLLEHGADVNARALSMTPLHRAATFGNVEVARVLLEYGADVNAKDKKGWTPLHIAATDGHVGVVELLLERGADPSIKNEEDKTPLDVARERGHAEVVRVIEEFVRRGRGAKAVVTPKREPLHRRKKTSRAAAPSILGADCSELYAGEWGRLVVRVRGSGTASISLEGEVEWLDPGRVKLSGESMVEVPVKPKAAGEVPVKVIVKSSSGDDARIAWLKVVEKVGKCPACGAQVEPGAKYCWKCGAKLS